MKKLVVKLDVEEILEFVKNGEDCKLEVCKDEFVAVMPAEAAGYEDAILVQTFDAYDYEDAGDEEAYIDWLKSCYKGEEFEAGEYLITFEF